MYGAYRPHTGFFGAQPGLSLRGLIDTWELPATDAWRFKLFLADRVHGGWDLDAPPDEDLASITEYDLEIRAKIERKKSRSTILRKIKGLQATRGFQFGNPTYYTQGMIDMPDHRHYQPEACS